MIEDILNAKSPRDIEIEIAKKVVIRRKEAGLTQVTLSRKSGVSYGSIKRFESKGEISLLSLIKISFALHMEDDFLELFKKKKYKTLQEVIDEQS